MKKTVLLYIVLFITLVIIMLYSTRFVGDPYHFSATFYYGRFVIVLFSILVLLKILQLLGKIKLKKNHEKYLLTGWSIMLFILCSEGIFMFVSRSFGTSYPLADQNWVRHYWKPINKYGYRDKEVDTATTNGKTNILVLGSSYAAGDGIKNHKDRFSDLLAQKLSGNYRVYNLGSPGSDATDEYRRLLEFPVKPDILILSHTTKSIKGTVETPKSKTLKRYKVDEELNIASRFLVQNSYFLNYLYWKYLAPKQLSKRYLEDIENNEVFLYLREEVLSKHFINLEKFITYCNDKSIPLIVVSFTSMNEGIGISKMIVEKPIERFFKEKNILFISVYDLVKDLSISERTVNSTDSHPSQLVHELVALKLHESIGSIEPLN